MFSKKKSTKKDKDVPVVKTSKEKSEKKKESSKEIKKSSSKDKKDKDKRGSSDGSEGFAWVQTDAKHKHDKDGKPSKDDKKPSNATSQNHHPKYGPQNLNLVKKSSVFDAKKSSSDKKKAVKSDKPAPMSNGILKPGPHVNGAVAMTSNVMPQVRMPPTQVTFAGPDNRVHQSVVNVTNSLLRKPINPTQVNGNLPHTTSNNLNAAQSLYAAHDNITPHKSQSVPKEISSEEVNHYLISHGQDTKHVTSINVNTKTSVHLDDKVPVSHYVQMNSGSKPVSRESSFSNGPVSREGSFSKKVVSREGSFSNKTVSNDVVRCTTCGEPKGNGHNHTATNNIKPQAVVLAEVNIPNSFVAAPKKEMFPSTKRDGDIQYAELTFKKRGDTMGHSLSQNSLNGESKENKPKGILKQTKSGKRVEFNNDLDVKFFNTLSTLSRHESLESLSIYDEDAYGRDFYMKYDQYARPQPLDDTDLYMYTMRKNRRSPAKYPSGKGTSAYREQPAPWAAYPWIAYDGCKGSMRHKQPTVRTIRMVPPGGDRRYAEWLW